MTAVAADRRLLFLLTAGQRRVQRWLEAEMLTKGGLTAAQSGLLFFLGGKDGAPIGEAAEMLDVAPSAMTGLVDRMDRAGLVERRPDPEDRRGQRLYLTEKGQDARETVKGGLDGLNQRLTEGFSEAEVAIVARWLASLAHKFPKRE